MEASSIRTADTDGCFSTFGSRGYILELKGEIYYVCLGPSSSAECLYIETVSCVKYNTVKSSRQAHREAIGVDICANKMRISERMAKCIRTVYSK